MLAVVTLAPVGASPAASRAVCGSGHIAVALAGFQSRGFAQYYYYALEGDPFQFRVVFEGDNCQGDTVSARWNMADVTATSGADYMPTSGRTPPLCDVNHGCNGVGHHDVQVTINEDSTAEPETGPGVVETARIFLSEPQGGRLSQVSSAPLHVIDDDGTQRIALDGSDVSQSESYAQLDIPVYRAGDAAAVGTSTAVSVSSSPTGPNPATEGQDYTAPSSISFEPGERVEFVTFSIINDTSYEAPQETFALTISGSGVRSPSSTTITIVDNEEKFAPQSRLHHPRHGRKYKRGDYRLREIHVFTSDQGGSAVVRAELALRKNLKNGNCAWWTGKEWKGGGCGAQRWVNLSAQQADFFYHRMGALRPSVRSKIKDYTAFSRAIDGAGNVESRFESGRNENTFEVRASKGRR